MSDELQTLTLREIEERIIREGIARMDVLQLAKALGIGKTTLYRKLKQYGLIANTQTLPWSAADKAKIDRLVLAVVTTAEFLDECVGSTAPLLAKELRESLRPFNEATDGDTPA